MLFDEYSGWFKRKCLQFKPISGYVIRAGLSVSPQTATHIGP